MKRLILATVSLGALAGCWNFDAAYDGYCDRVRCEGGAGGGLVPAGGGSSGGSSGGAAGGTAGGSAGGSVGGGGAAGGTAGGVAGGSAGGTAGGSAGGVAGGTAGGAGGGTVDSGVPDAGLPPCTQDFCLWRNTQRTDLWFGAGVMGDSLSNAAAIFKVRGTTPRAATFAHGGQTPGLTMGTLVSMLGTGTEYGDLWFGRGTPDDYYFFTNASLITAPIRRVQGGGLPVIVYQGTCGSTSFSPRSFAIVDDGGVLLVGGNDEGICEVEVNTFTSRLVQPEVNNGPGNDVNAIYKSPGDEIFFTTEDGYVYKVGVGRVSPQLDTTSWGMLDIDGLSGDDVWAVGRDGVVAWRVPDGGFEQFTNLNETLYGLEVTTEGVFVGGFGAIFYRTASTDGGFQRYPLPTVGSVSRPYHLKGGPGYLHVVGDYGFNQPSGNPSGSFFMTFRTRTR